MTASHTYAAAGTYPVVLTVTDDGGVTDNDAQDVLVGLSSMHIGDLDASSSPGTSPAGKWDATVAIIVHDGGEGLISNATVSGSWRAGASGTGSCMTDPMGQCNITRTNINKNSASVTFTVDNMTHTTLYYNSGANHDDEEDGDSSDGTTITILKP